MNIEEILESDHHLDCNAATMLAYIHNKRLRQIFEVGAISLCQSVNNHPGFSAFHCIWENLS